MFHQRKIPSYNDYIEAKYEGLYKPHPQQNGHSQHTQVHPHYPHDGHQEHQEQQHYQATVTPFHSTQEYEKLRDEWRGSGRLFEDDTFPADNRLLTDDSNGNISHYFDGQRHRASEIEWLRPQVYTSNL